MKTVYIGDEEVNAYAKDLVARLNALGDDFPLIWCPIGHSGDHLVRCIEKHVPSRLRPVIEIVEVAYNKTTGTASYKDPSDATRLRGRNVLVLDSSVHSGGSMLACLRHVNDAGVARALSYSLVIKRSSKFIPHYFGVVVGDHDRALFLLDTLPNNRLYSKKYRPLGILRKIDSDDVSHSGSLNTGVGSLDKITFGDLFYDHKANGYDVFIVEDGSNLAGFIKLKLRSGRSVSIDVVATDKTYRGKGVGGALMRFAETLGRAHQCKFVDLWAIQNMKSMYEDMGFKFRGDTIDAGGNEHYTYMQKDLLYHFSLLDDDHPPT